MVKNSMKYPPERLSIPVIMLNIDSAMSTKHAKMAYGQLEAACRHLWLACKRHVQAGWVVAQQHAHASRRGRTFLAQPADSALATWSVKNATAATIETTPKTH